MGFGLRLAHQSQVIGLELYDDEMDGKPRESGVKRTQWLEAGSAQLAGKTLLIVDEVGAGTLRCAVVLCFGCCGCMAGAQPASKMPLPWARRSTAQHTCHDGVCTARWLSRACSVHGCVGLIAGWLAHALNTG